MTRISPSTTEFQSTLPRGERLSSTWRAAWTRRISIHAPARGATGTEVIIRRSQRRNFNPRSREGSDIHHPSASQFHRNFNPRSREGSDDAAVTPEAVDPWISIHAPARGATPPLFSHLYTHMISIHAPARGATVTGKENLEIIGISIHAPARGATRRRSLRR